MLSPLLSLFECFTWMSVGSVLLLALFQGHNARFLSPNVTQLLFWSFIFFCSSFPQPPPPTDDDIAASEAKATKDNPSVQLHKHSWVINGTFVLLGCFATLAIVGLKKEPSVDLLYIVLTVIFHTSEFLFVCHVHPDGCSWFCFLFNNGTSYSLYVAVSVIERAMWRFYGSRVFFSNIFWTFSWKQHIAASLAKFSLCVQAVGFTAASCGIAFRLAAFASAHKNFTHIVATKKKPSAYLVQTGVYRYVRHPGYLGWFLWSTGSQLMLLNPLSFGLQVVYGHQFFKNRIAWEEQHLRLFFGLAYKLYCLRTPLWMPGIQTYLDELDRYANSRGPLKILYHN